MCALLHFIYRKLVFVIKSGIQFTESYMSVIGLPQGDPLSAVLFCLFVYGPIINGICVAYIMYADDLAIVCESVEELQGAIDNLSEYCVKNGLKINADKTKCMAFFKGRPPQCSFMLDGRSLEVVNEFVYLGFTFTTQLSFSKHLQSIVTKANSRCGILATRLPLNDLPLDLVLKIFHCYVTPLYRVGLQLWLGSCSDSAIKSANSSFTKYLKRYLGVPFHSNNAITHYVTNTTPLINQLHDFLGSGLGAYGFPSCLDGYQVSFLAATKNCDPYEPTQLVPSSFWLSRMFNTLPTRFCNRKKLMYEIFDLEHEIYCTREDFHVNNGHDCQCRVCGQVMSFYHKNFCTL